MADLKAILISARQIVERGWTKGKFRSVVDGVECFCSLGAICKSSPDSDSYNAALDRFALANGISCRQSVPRWNDAKRRTREQVLAAFDRAIANADVFEAMGLERVEFPGVRK